MEKVNKLLAMGFSFADAVKAALGKTVEQVATEYRMPRPHFSEMLNGRRVPDERQLAALTTEIGGTSEQWLDLWFKQAQKRAKALV